jgi:hypothetical protein
MVVIAAPLIQEKRLAAQVGSERVLSQYIRYFPARRYSCFPILAIQDGSITEDKAEDSVKAEDRVRLSYCIMTSVVEGELLPFSRLELLHRLSTAD